MVNIHESFRPYQRIVFYRLFITFIIIILASNIAIYYVRTKRLFGETQTTLKQVAINVAVDIPVSIHEGLTKPEQQKSEEYHKIESYFRSVMDGNPKIDDIYTLRPTDTPHQMIFVVSGMETKDINGNNYIEDFEIKPQIGEEYDTSEFPELEKGLSAPSVDKTITSDKWGQWLSGYAPLKDDAGKSVALVGVDLAASFIAAQRREMLSAILWVDLALLPFLIIVAYFLAKKLSRPFRILAQGMNYVAHGDFEHRLPLKKKGEESFFIELFNKIMSMLESVKKQEKEKHD